MLYSRRLCFAFILVTGSSVSAFQLPIRKASSGLHASIYKSVDQFPSTTSSVPSYIPAPPPPSNTGQIKHTDDTQYAYASNNHTPDMQFAENIHKSEPIRVQGGALRTWSFGNVERVLVAMTANDSSLYSMTHEGRLMNAKIELCQGPDNVPMKMEIKSGKGKLRPFKALIETPGGHSSLFIRNIGSLEFPFIASVAPAVEDAPPDGDVIAVSSGIYETPNAKILQGGAIDTFPLDANVKNVKVILKTTGRPLNAKVELIQGPNSLKHTIDLYTENGDERPFFTVIETPGVENVIRVVNTAPMEFPMVVSVEPFMIEASSTLIEPN